MSNKETLLLNIKKRKALYIMTIPILVYYIVFHYLPMYGLVIAFQNYVPARGFLNNQWVGLQHFIDFFTDRYFARVFRNTVLINLYQLVFGFPVPILFALLLNEVSQIRFKKMTQTITYMPHFISSVVVCGIVIDFTKSTGLFPTTIGFFGGDTFNLLSRPEYFRSIFVTMNIWQQFGWGSIIFLAALSGIDPNLYEAATIDGANRFKQTIYITIPSILPTIVILLILRIGRIMSLGWEKIILLYSPLTYETADVISTYAYRKGLIQFDYSYGAAIGLFNSIINFTLLISANKISSKVNSTSLW
jgi:putative aldouronate transport system permease protein